MQTFKNFLSHIVFESMLAEACKAKAPTSRMQGSTNDVEDRTSPLVCYLDGSWVEPWSGGTGFIILNGSQLVMYRADRVQASSPLQAEAMALREAVAQVTQLGMTNCAFIYDCQVLVDAVNSTEPPTQVDWKGFAEVYEVWKKFKTNQGFFCKYTPREMNEAADNLAKKGRILGFCIYSRLHVSLVLIKGEGAKENHLWPLSGQGSLLRIFSFITTSAGCFFFPGRFLLCIVSIFQ